MNHNDTIANLRDLHGMTDRELRRAEIELCAAGLLTATNGKPGEKGTTYAVAWLPLDRPERFSEQVRRRHAANMKKIRGEDDAEV